MRKKTLLIMGLLAILTVVATLLLTEPSLAGKLEEALAQTPTGAGQE